MNVVISKSVRVGSHLAIELGKALAVEKAILPVLLIHGAEIYGIALIVVIVIYAVYHEVKTA